jgi:predicted DCC family thiol-disulfide oxidoreductase YuxK
MSQPSPLLLVYDAESAPCRGLVDWIQRRDRDCLIVPFPLQNAELPQMAPELAGQPLQGEIHGLDTRTRVIKRGSTLLPMVFRRLPGWRYLTPFVTIPAVSTWVYALLRRTR